MTKKSLQRLERDKKEKELDNYFNTNTIFDELNTLRDLIDEKFKTLAYLGQLSANKELIANLEDPKSVLEKMSLLSTDIVGVGAEYKRIKAFHQGKTGGAKNQDELMDALTCGQAYQNMVHLISNVIMPSAGTLFEEFSKAEIKFNASVDKLSQTEVTP